MDVHWALSDSWVLVVHLETIYNLVWAFSKPVGDVHGSSKEEKDIWVMILYAKEGGLSKGQPENSGSSGKSGATLLEVVNEESIPLFSPLIWRGL